MLLLMLTTITLAFAEVTSLQTNSESFYKGEQIKFSGIVEKDSIGLVTIVIRDLNDKFVVFAQAVINYNNTFEKTIKIGDGFLEHGMYNATGFILNMTKGITTDFAVSLNGAPIILKEEQIESEPIEEKLILKDEPEKEIEIQDVITTSNIVDFVDSSKSSQYYIDRYYTEVAYKSWFDRNYPNLTIEEAVGHTDNIVKIKSTVQEIMDNEIIPEAQASSIVEPTPQLNNNSDIAQISLAVAGLGILFGAVYGIKRKVDDNSNLISINRETIKKKLIQPIIGSNPKDILQTRLAKGEITLEEYEKIKSKLY
ncbi:MAG: SHOCT domain-containing protein [Nitrosopumilus sp.]|nr:SHOCT domain-containing protein [Nitrosopumilus sp.]